MRKGFVELTELDIEALYFAIVCATTKRCETPVEKHLVQIAMRLEDARKSFRPYDQAGLFLVK